jgi:hypothetical protein
MPLHYARNPLVNGEKVESLRQYGTGYMQARLGVYL